MAEGTSLNLITQWHKFVSFCKRYDISEWPASVGTLCLYAQHLSRQFRSVQSIHNYLNGVRLLHLLSSAECPNFGHFMLKLTLKGLARRKRAVVKQAEPVTPKILLDIKSKMDLSTKLHKVLWAMFLVAFYLMLRKSNLTPTAKAKFDGSNQLTRGDLKLKRNAAVFRIKWTKTLQFGRRTLTIPVPANARSKLCPVRALRRMIKALPGKAHQPLFMDELGHPIPYSAFLRNSRKFLRGAGYKQALFSGHSFRRGATEFAFKAKVSPALIKVHGDWSSSCYERYFQFPYEARAKVGISMKSLINEMGF